MSNLDELRSAINALDDELLRLLNDRAELALKIGRVKQENKHSIYDPGREDEIISRLTGVNRQGIFPNGPLRVILNEIMSACRSIQAEDTQAPKEAGATPAPVKAPGKVAFLGPEGTFSHEACIQNFGESVETAPKSSIREVFGAVERGEAGCGVVPIENSLEGAIGQTLDMLTETGLNISGEIKLSVRLCLMSRSGDQSAIKSVLSHPQPLGQCRKWLESNMKGVQVNDTASTTIAAETAKNNESAAAIASKRAAEKYGLKIIHECIEDNPNNFTRFFIISKDRPKPTGSDKTSLLFSVKDEPGALFNILKPFADSGINLTKIESRPSKKKAWEYLFFVDLLGHYDEKKVKDAVDELEKNCVFLKVLGSYPVAAEG